MLPGDKTVYLSNNHNLNVTFIVVSLNSQFILFSFLLHLGVQILPTIPNAFTHFRNYSVPDDTHVLFIPGLHLGLYM